MKYKAVLYLLFCTAFFKANTQVFLVNLTDSGFIFNENDLKAEDKTCYILNCLSKNEINDGDGNLLKPLLIFKVFDYRDSKNDISKPANSILFKDFLKTTVLTKLARDIPLKTNANNFEMTNSDQNILVIDSLVVCNGKSYTLLKGGVCLLEFFNVCNYKQLSPLQTNQSILNLGADTVQIHSWAGDNLPIPMIDEMIDGRFFLLKKRKNDYTFFRHPFNCSDCPLSFYNEYVYRKDYGVVAFKSKHLLFNTDPATISFAGRIIESDKYYYFK